MNDEDCERIRQIASKIIAYQEAHPDSPVPLDALVCAGVITADERAFLESHHEEDEPLYPMETGVDMARVHRILSDIIAYQQAHSSAAVPLDTLLAAGVLTADDQAFLESHSIKYKPHALGDYHAGDMFEIPTGDGCIFTGPNRPSPPEYSTRLPELAGILQLTLRQTGADDAATFFIQLSPEDGMAISPRLLAFILHRTEWRARAAALKSVAAEHGLLPFQDSPEVQGNYLLSFTTTADPSTLTRIALDLLRRGLGFTDTDQVIYSGPGVEGN